MPVAVSIVSEKRRSLDNAAFLSDELSFGRHNDGSRPRSAFGVLPLRQSLPFERKELSPDRQRFRRIAFEDGFQRLPFPLGIVAGVESCSIGVSRRWYSFTTWQRLPQHRSAFCGDLRVVDSEQFQAG